YRACPGPTYRCACGYRCACCFSFIAWRLAWRSDVNAAPAAAVPTLALAISAYVCLPGQRAFENPDRAAGLAENGCEFPALAALLVQFPFQAAGRLTAEIQHQIFPNHGCFSNFEPAGAEGGEPRTSCRPRGDNRHSPPAG